MRLRTVLGSVVVVGALLWLALLLIGWNRYVSLSVVAEYSANFGGKQRADLEASFTKLLYQTVMAGVLLSAGILVLNSHSGDDTDPDAEPSESD